MANLPEKNITTVSAITSIPSNTNIFVNANGQFGQASINDVVKASNVVSDATLNAMKEFIDNQFQVLTGSPILAQGTEDGYMPSFKGKGGSSQNSYSGKNLLENTEGVGIYAGVTVTKNDDGSITLNGTCTEMADIEFNYTTTLKAGSYIFNRGKSAGVGSNTTYQFVLFAPNGTKYWTGYEDYPFTFEEDSLLDLRLYIYAGAVFNNTTFYPMIRLATITDDTYEPFTGAQPSPNPSYPQQIKSKGDCGWFDGELLQGYYAFANGVYSSASNYVCSKNPIPCKEGDDILLQYVKSMKYIGLIYYDENMTYVGNILLEDKSEVNHTAPTNAKFFHFNIGVDSATEAITPATAKKIVVTINGTYAVKVTSVGKNLVTDITNAKNTTVTDGVVKQTGADTQNYIQFKFQRYMDNKYVSQIGEVMDASELKRYSKIITKTIDYNQLFFGINGKNIDTLVHIDVSHLKNNTDYVLSFEVTNLTQGSISWKNIQIEIGTEATDYEPYKEHNEWIPLSEPLRGIGEVIDEIKATDGLYRGHRKFKEIVFDGSADWVLSTSFVGAVYVKTLPYGLKSFGLGLCDKFTYVSSDYAYNKGKFMIDPNSIRFWIQDTAFESIDEVRSWFNENPVTVLYEIAEEEIEELDQSPFYRLKTFEGVTHISASDDMEMVVEVPTSRAGGVASIGWSKGNLAQIETQNLSAKIAELQTAMVNM